MVVLATVYSSCISLQFSIVFISKIYSYRTVKCRSNPSTSGSTLGAVCSFKIVAVLLIKTEKGLSLAAPGHYISSYVYMDTNIQNKGLIRIKMLNALIQFGSFRKKSHYD